MRRIETHHAVSAALTLITDALIEAIATRGHAVLFLSGGSSPKPLYERLSTFELDWKAVTVGLVDERVDPRGSNADFVKSSLLQNAAAAATFVPMTEGGYGDLIPADLCVMGMGTDGHTASWFPDSADLSRAMNPDSDEIALRVDASGCPGAGEFAERLTLTLPAVMASRHILLFAPGAAKRAVFDADAMLPVHALTHSQRFTAILDPKDA